MRKNRNGIILIGVTRSVNMSHGQTPGPSAQRVLATEWEGVKTSNLESLPEYWLSVHQCQTEIRRQSYGGERKNGFISLPGKEGTQ